MDAGSSTLNPRYLHLKKSFQLAVRPLLTAFSKEDVHKAFPTFTDAEREGLYRMFVHEEFDSICQEAKVATALDKVDQLVEEQTLDVLSTDKTDIADIKERISRAKKDEIHYLTSMLEQAGERNSTLRTQIESLTNMQDFSSVKDAVEKLRRWNADYEKIGS